MFHAQYIFSAAGSFTNSPAFTVADIFPADFQQCPKHSVDPYRHIRQLLESLLWMDSMTVIGGLYTSDNETHIEHTK